MQRVVLVLEGAGLAVEHFRCPLGIGKPSRRRERLACVGRDPIAADILEVVTGALHEAQEQERAVAGRLTLAVPPGQDLGRFLRPRASVFPGGGDEVVDEVIGDLAAGRELHRLEIVKRDLARLG